MIANYDPHNDSEAFCSTMHWSDVQRGEAGLLAAFMLLAALLTAGALHMLSKVRRCST